MPRLLLAALLLGLVMAAAGRAYDLAEIDGDDSPGNAPILLGWESNRFPLPFSIDEDPPAVLSAGELRSSVTDAFQAWETASEANATFVEVAAPGGSGVTTAVVDASLAETSCGGPGDCSHLVVTVSSDWAGLSGQDMSTVAVTLLKFDPNARRVVDADVLLNDEDHDFAVDGNVTRFDAPAVLTHELGHVLAIGHPASNERMSSTMWPDTVTGDTSLRSLEPDDANAVLYLYAPLTQPVPPPDTNVLGLLARGDVPSSGSGGCAAGPGDGPFTAALALLWVALFPALRRPSRG